jgi:hypothetical protein
MMPTYERRFFLGLLTKDAREKQDNIEATKEQQAAMSTGKGKRKTRVSGEALKTRMKSGDLPIK